MLKTKYKVLGAVLVAASLSVWSAQSALASGQANSTDSNHGSHVVYTTVNHHLTAYDIAYDGWSAYSRMTYNVGGGGTCVDSQGFNTSVTCVLTPGYKISYNSCLGNPTGTNLAYCSYPNPDNS